MSVIKYIGRVNYYNGKTLWEIVGNLKDYGVGRIIVRSIFERYPEPSYMKIVKVEATLNDIIYIKQSGIDVPQNLRKVKVLVEKVFRGRKFDKLFGIHSASYKADYRLIPKDEEEEYCKITSALQERVVTPFVEYPPLLKEIILIDCAKKGMEPPADMRLPVRFNKNKYNAYKRDETSKDALPIDIGRRTSTSKYYDDLPLHE